MHDSLQTSDRPSATIPNTADFENGTCETNETCGEVSALERLDEIQRQIGSALASWQDPEQVVQMRRFHRLPFDQPLLLTAIDEQTDEPTGEPIRVYGRDISHGGLSIEHEGPLICRKAVLTLPSGSGRTEALIVRLTWCRFTRRGTYQSGGPFVRATVSSNGWPRVMETEST